MPDYLGEDQRKTKAKDEKEGDKPIKGEAISNGWLDRLFFFSALDEAEIALLKSYVSEWKVKKFEIFEE